MEAREGLVAGSALRQERRRARAQGHPPTFTGSDHGDRERPRVHPDVRDDQAHAAAEQVPRALASVGERCFRPVDLGGFHEAIHDAGRRGFSTRSRPPRSERRPARNRTPLGRSQATVHELIRVAEPEALGAWTTGSKVIADSHACTTEVGSTTPKGSRRSQRPAATFAPPAPCRRSGPGVLGGRVARPEGSQELAWHWTSRSTLEPPTP
jgi:hypothetical protein